MPSFEVTGRGRETSRKRKRIYAAYDEAEARQIAEADGTIVEGIQILPDEPATEAQLSYARDLGISIPENPTKDELRDLLSCHLDHDKPATQRHKSFARAYRVYHTRFVGKRVLFNLIFAALQTPGRERELVAWFTYRVYRELMHGAEDAPITGPDDPAIRAVADELWTESSIIDSIRRYRGSDLIWFGQWTAPDSSLHNGGSNRTIAYKRASRLLSDSLNLRTEPPTRPTDTTHSISTTNHSYRYVLVLIVVGLVLILLLLAVCSGCAGMERAQSGCVVDCRLPRPRTSEGKPQKSVGDCLRSSAFISGSR